MENEYYIYIYVIDDTEEVFYVGKGKGNRAYSGKRNKFCEDMRNTHNWSVIILHSKLTEEEAFLIESELIIKFKKEGNRITNQTDGGGGISGYIMPEEIKKKISESSKKRWEDEEYLSRQMEHRLNGVYQSDEFRAKISNIVQGENNPNYGNRWTEEQKQKMSKKRKENGKSKGENNSRATKIKCVETGKTYDYIKLASEEMGFKSQSSITVALNNPNRTAGGFHWEKVQE